MTEKEHDNANEAKSRKKKKIVFCIAYPNAESFDMQKQLKAKDLFFFLQRRCNPAYYFLFSYRKSKISEITVELVDFQMTRPLI